MKFSYPVKLYIPTKIEAEHGYNTKYNVVTRKYNDRFNCPWENKITIEGELVDTTTVSVHIYLETYNFGESEIKEVIEKILSYYEQHQITIGLKRTKTIEIIISDKSMRDLVSIEEFIAGKLNIEEIKRNKLSWETLNQGYQEKVGGFRRGLTIPIANLKKVKIFISLYGCNKTIKRDENKFKKSYSEYHKKKSWSPKGFVYYVLAHEIGHAIIPLEEEHGGEIFPIIIGSRFAAKNNYIFVPQGRELNNAWKTVDIVLSRKLDRDTRDGRLKECERWLENLPTYRAFLNNLEGEHQM